MGLLFPFGFAALTSAFGFVQRAALQHRHKWRGLLADTGSLVKHTLMSNKDRGEML